jgi:tRNA A-37 threonylcarbamoyl transferase component Bud32
VIMPDANGPGSAEQNSNSPQQPSTTPYPDRFVAPPADQLSRLIPQVEVLQLLGQGGMGAVYKARQAKLDRLVALKVLPSEPGRDSAFATRFAREARALAKLNDPHIVAIHDFGESGGLFYFLMEFVDGVNLRHLLKAGPLPPAEVFSVVMQICDALQYAHDEGVVHRDIKPENVLVDKRGRVKIADFGLAKLLGQTATDRALTASQQVMGTWNYMAPEQIEHPLRVDHRAEIYSLGVMYYEMLTGGLPLGHFAVPSQRAPVDARTDVVILRALAKEPEQRYQHIHEMKAAILLLEQGLPSHSRSGGDARLLQGSGTGGPVTALWATASLAESGLTRPAAMRSATSPGPMRTFFASTTNWAIICCFLVLLAAIPPWLTNRFPGMPVIAYFILVAIGGLLFMLLLVTSFIEPVPLWRALAVIATGADVTVITIAYLGYYGMYRLFSSDIDPISVWVCVCLALGILLILIGTFQLRGVLIRLYRSSSAAHGKTTRQ